MQGSIHALIGVLAVIQFASPAGAQTTAPALTKLSLVDAKTGEILVDSISNTTYRLTDVPGRCLSVRAIPANSVVQSVRFGLGSNANFVTENVATYDLMISDGSRGCLQAGSNVVTATPYSADNASGSTGTALTRNFKISWQLIKAADTSWRYLTTDTDPGTAWRQPSYAESTAWKTGAAPLGYRESGLKTIIPSGPVSNNYRTSYYRHAFHVSTPSSIGSLVAKVRRRAGMVIYLNGAEVFRMGVNPHAAATYSGLATTTYDPIQSFEVPLPQTLLASGKNVIAVEMHIKDNNTGIFFDLELAGDGALPQPTNVPTVISKLWGQSGELWNPAGVPSSDPAVAPVYLPDYSFAGYHFGEKSLPRAAVTVDVTKAPYYANPAAGTDDTAAVLKAIDETESGVIYFPAGEYHINSVVWIRKPNLVLRGAGTGKTIIKFTQPLHVLNGKMPFDPNDPDGWSKYSYIGGLIWVQGGGLEKDFYSTSTIQLAKESKRGQKILYVDKTTGVSKGMLIRLNQINPSSGAEANKLAWEIMGQNKAAYPREDLMGDKLTNFVAHVTDFTATTILIDRPLPIAVKPVWGAKILKFEPTVSEVGIEDLQIRFPDNNPYPGHFGEKGFNGIYMERVVHSWVRNVIVHNGDNGVTLSGSFFNTLTGINITSGRQRPHERGETAHHGINMSSSADNLITNFKVLTKTMHDIGLDGPSSRNVYENGFGIDLCMDHHGNGNSVNLYTNLDLGAGTRAWNSGGATNSLPHAAAFETFWTLRSRNPIKYPRSVETSSDSVFGPLLNLIGLRFDPAATAPDPAVQWRIEKTAPEQLHPRNLHEAQLNKRLGR